MYQAVVFDLDGTLLNTIDDLANAGNFVCRTNGWREHLIEDYKRFVGNGIPVLVERFSPHEFRTPEMLTQSLKLFRQYYAQHQSDCTRPYNGIASLLQQLKQNGISLAVLTNKEHTFAKQLVEQYFGQSCFDIIQGSLPNVPTKPNPAALLNLCKQTDFAGKHTLFVGDSDVDILTANNAHLDSCGVLWGFRTERELKQAGATYCISHPQQLIEIICGT